MGIELRPESQYIGEKIGSHDKGAVNENVKKTSFTYCVSYSHRSPRNTVNILYYDEIQINRANFKFQEIYIMWSFHIDKTHYCRFRWTSVISEIYKYHVK